MSHRSTPRARERAVFALPHAIRIGIAFATGIGEPIGIAFATGIDDNGIAFATGIGEPIGIAFATGVPVAIATGPVAAPIASPGGAGAV